jgi:hypothetical protein
MYMNTKAFQDFKTTKNLTALQAATKRQLAVASKSRSGSAHGGSSTANSKLKTATQASAASTGPFTTTDCTGGNPMHPGLSSASSTQLRKLAQYEQLCASAPIERMSFFVPTPTSLSNARADAYDVAAQLKEFARFGIKPLVFMEPTDGGGLVDLQSYQNGNYDQALDTFYVQLRSLGIDDNSMGTWVLLPEGNLPEWTTLDPGVYGAVVARTAQLQKKQFPGSRVSLMLDSESYPSAGSWSGGKYVSLLPYVQNIPRGLIDSFGLQGFPWAAPAGQAGSVYNPAVYLRTDFAMEAAHSLGVSDVWVNTGTFHTMYSGQPTKTVTLSPQQRKTMLDGVLAQMRIVQAAGFNVAVHVFAEDKSTVSEGTDWSYWKTTPDGSADASVFSTFVHDARSSGTPLWLYDSTSH